MKDDRGARVLDDGKVTQLQAVSKKTLQRVTESNKALREFNNFSEQELEQAKAKLHRHAQTLTELKSDLMHVYKQLRVIKELLPRKLHGEPPLA